MKNNKALGQHWLNNRAILNEIADYALGYKPSQEADESAYDFAANRGKMTCVEIGPGLGTLTSSLLKNFKDVIAVEFDQRLAENLPKSFPGTNLTVVNEDFLKFDLEKIKAPYVVAGNIPYYITSPIIEKILKAENRPERVVLLIQKEVAERILDMRETMLSLMVKNYANAYPGVVVPKDEFTPPPKVDSQVIILEPHAPVIPEKVFKMIQLGFSMPRKKVTRNLSPLMFREDIKDIFIKLNINIDVRPGELHLEDWYKIYQQIYK